MLMEFKPGQHSAQLTVSEYHKLIMIVRIKYPLWMQLKILQQLWWLQDFKLRFHTWLRRSVKPKPMWSLTSSPVNSTLWQMEGQWVKCPFISTPSLQQVKRSNLCVHWHSISTLTTKEYPPGMGTIALNCWVDDFNKFRCQLNKFS